MKENALILFLKQSLLGQVKTRLAETIGHHSALLVYKKLLKRTASTLFSYQQFNSTTDIYLYYTPEISKNDEFDKLVAYKRKQSSGDLGEKLATSSAEIFAEKYKKIVIIGSDCYDLSTTHLSSAFKKLSDTNIVIGPTKDGGYYLIGMNKFYSFLFEDMPWSTANVCSLTKKKAKKNNCSYELIEELVDIDTIHEWSLYPELKN